MKTDKNPLDDLTRNQALVLGALAEADAPLSAYRILERLRGQGFRAPPQVSRALDKLVERGAVHRLESLNAFVACRQPDCGTGETTIFVICEACGKVSELSDRTISRALADKADGIGFALDRSSVELRGHCVLCRSQGSA